MKPVKMFMLLASLPFIFQTTMLARSPFTSWSPARKECGKRIFWKVILFPHPHKVCEPRPIGLVHERTPFVIAQPAFDQAIAPFVTHAHNAVTVADFQSLANDFARVANAYPTEWLGYYYAAWCNVHIAWAYQQDGDKIEPFAKLAEAQIRKAESLAGSDNKALSEIYCIWSMVDRAYIFISPMSNGRKYGPVANQYLEKARKANPDNARALYLDAWVKYNTPKLWGGDKDKAKELLQQALTKLQGAASSPNFPHWGKSDCDAMLAQYK